LRVGRLAVEGERKGDPGSVRLLKVEQAAQIGVKVERHRRHVVAAAGVRREAQRLPVGQRGPAGCRAGRRHHPTHRAEHRQHHYQRDPHQAHLETRHFGDGVEIDQREQELGEQDARRHARLEHRR